MEECGFREPLLRWWEETGPRSYPWRRAQSLYEILVALVLLRKTRRDRVAEVYPRFINRYPSPEALAAAPVPEIEESIKPLGLTSRARVLKELGEALSRGVADRELEKLPGIGPYTISTMKTVLGMTTELEPDTSITRLLARYHDLQDPKDIKKILNKCAPGDPDERGKYLLALIDLAWEICRPRHPKCRECPLRGHCREYKQKRQSP